MGDINTGSQQTQTQTSVEYVELVGIVNSLTAKLAEMGTAQENLAVKLAEMGTMQENLAGKVFVEKTYDIGEGEAWTANMKRSYDEYQEVGIESIKRSRNMADQIIQNAIESANMIAKQAIRHGDIAINSQWKPRPKDKVGE